MNSKKNIFIQKNKGELLPIEHTLSVLESHEEFPLDEYLPENVLKHFKSFTTSVNTLAKINAEQNSNQDLSSILKFAIEKRKNIAVIDEFSTYQLSNYLNLPLKEVTLNRSFLENWLSEEEGRIKNGRQET